MAASADLCIISVAVTGALTDPASTPYLPITPEQIAQSTLEAWRAGAAIAHLHVREPDGRPTQRLDYFREVIGRIREAGCDIVLNLTTGGHPDMTHEERMQTLELEPELASFDAGSLNMNEGVFHNPPGFLRELARRMRERRVKPELEIFDTGMIENCKQLVREGLIDEPLYFQFVLGVRGGAPATPKTLLHMVESLPPGSHWSVIGVGRGQLPMNAMAILMGGHVRTGLEDNIYYRRGELATSNAQLVERLARLIREFGREVASPDDARRILGLKGMAQTRA